MTINYELHLEGERHIFFAEAPASLPERKLPPRQPSPPPIPRPCAPLPRPKPGQKQGRAARASNVRLHTSLAAQLAS